jgi:abhydrolase domain-containing protein 12
MDWLVSGCRIFEVPSSILITPANRTLNLKIQTRDNETIGAWFVLSGPYYQSLPSIPTDVAAHVIPALKEYPVILLFHGNAGSRAASCRIPLYQGFSSRLSANVLTIDYRGFADSTGQPSEAGLLIDARSAFDWLVAHGKRPEDILIVGHSLGTGVSGMLGAELSSEGINCRGVVLLSVGRKFIPMRSLADGNSPSQA